MRRVLVLLFAVACGRGNTRTVSPPPVVPLPQPQRPQVVSPTTSEGAPRPPRERLRIDAPQALHFRQVGSLPYVTTVRARAASLDLVATLGERRHKLVLTVTTVADGSSTTVELPDGFPTEIFGTFNLRVEKAGVELVHIGSDVRPGGVVRWSVDAGWSKPVEFPAKTRKEMGPSAIMATPLGDRWLVVPHNYLDVPWWTIDSTGVRPVHPPLGADAKRWHELTRSIEFSGGALLLVGDGTSPDGKGTGGGPGLTRGVMVTANQVAELGAPFPWPGRYSRVAAADGPAAAAVHGDAPAKLLLVDATGIVGVLDVPDGRPIWLRWMDRTLVAWGALRELPGETKDHATPVIERDMSGWIVEMRKQKRPVVHPFAVPAAAPPGWVASAQARIGDELCVWGGGSTALDDAAHQTFAEVEASTRDVLGGACVDPRTATVRLLAAEPPPGFCRVLADGPQALIECTEVSVDVNDSSWRASGPSTLWIVTADPAGG